MTSGTTQTERPRVILIHGLASSSILLRPMARRLRQFGFATSFWSYFSFRGSIEFHAQRLLNYIRQNQFKELHLVGHSMGSIISRRVCLETERPEISRMVMLAPPNRGSHVATRLSPYLGRICPALNELADRPDSYVRQLGEPKSVEIGIIGADGDLVVRPESLPLGCEVDTIHFPGMHSQLLLRPDVALSVAGFLRSGRFRDSES